MAEEAPEEVKTEINVNGQFIKDLSFEVPGAPDIFIEAPSDQPKMELNLDVQVHGAADNVFEVVLYVNAQANVGAQVAYILDLKYAGVFGVQAPEQYQGPILFGECPRLLFPFARAVIVDVTRDGGFQPLMLGPIDFMALYRQNAGNIELSGGDKKA